MSNGGHISCVSCTYSRSKKGICDVFGIETSTGILCRSFRMPKQSHRAAREKWPIIRKLKPGVVYGIDNDAFNAGNPWPAYNVSPLTVGKRENGVVQDLFVGCLLGGAVGDALGAPIEFMSLSEIRSRFGKDGIKTYSEAYGRKGAITDDTQMTLFTAEGLLRAYCRDYHKGICHPPSVVYHAYVRWLNTQGEHPKGGFEGNKDGWLAQIPELYSRRAPGNSCLSALQGPEMGTIEKPANDSKGCGGVMRIAPVGLMWDDPQTVFDQGCEIAAITHGHPTGYLAAGCLASIIFFIISGQSIETSITETIPLLKAKRGHEECLQSIELALQLSNDSEPSPEVIERLGAGWIAEEALAISLYCSLVGDRDVPRGVLLAVNHSGDSDSTGAITGNILGATLGAGSIPAEWKQELELSVIIKEMANDLFLRFKNTSEWRNKYPGW
ncbi:ADP-ribosylglycohydrolase family protein [Desulfoferrobacter suflitae]|uniref:ADP-ribosylglycohydrolase family protein n=1 Tax=Desulfoferrobacter suflitae TaxID=2865782 RepID=UPI00216428A4|nr:ADP-ribosylglycohydrolase family protein [Desulfoferrobacter suflitae]MCK8604373.1 ADP-ribosylglycohydrolase family protein [Desulfoferrobacter suflitae]